MISQNIREMQASGHPHDQAVAAALSNADRHRGFGGATPGFGGGGPIPYAIGGRADDGKPRVPIVAAGGEFVLNPRQVLMLARWFGGRTIKDGHELLDAFVVHVRKRSIKEQQKLKGPVKS